MPSSLLVTHGEVFTLGKENSLVSDGAVYVEDDAVVEVGPTARLLTRYPSVPRLDAEGGLVLPGSVCAHTHFYGAFARGMAIPGPPATTFVEILERLWWKLDRALRPADVRSSALVCLVDAIRHGCTTLVDHHASPEAVDGSLDVVAEAVKETGLRACLCYEVTDRNGEAGARKGIAENARFLRRCREQKDPQLSASFGLHAALTVSDATLEASRAAAEGLDTGFHVHVAEGKADQEESQRRHGLRVVERLQRRGVLGPKTIAAHCVHLMPREAEILRETGTWITHQPRSNMNNAVGLPDLVGLLGLGIPVALGNDGFSNDMFAEMKAAYLAHKHEAGDPRTLPGDVVMRMACAHNAWLCQGLFPRPLAEIAPGAFADLAVLDYAPTTPLTTGNLPWHLLFGVDGAHVRHTVASGRVLMKDRQLTQLDERAIAAEARARAVEVWGRLS